MSECYVETANTTLRERTTEIIKQLCSLEEMLMGIVGHGPKEGEMLDEAKGTLSKLGNNLTLIEVRLAGIEGLVGEILRTV